VADRDEIATVKPLRFRQSAMIQKQKNRLDKVSLISKKIIIIAVIILMPLGWC
jgi:hypothetical protein